jgi:hypothetical protein
MQDHLLDVPVMASTGQPDDGPQPSQIAVLQAGGVEVDLGDADRELVQLRYQGRIGVLISVPWHRCAAWPETAHKATRS